MSSATKNLEANCSPVIVRFVYFDHKNLVYGNRILLAKPENHPHNFEPIFVRERLSRHDAQIRERAEKMNLSATTYNIQLNFLWKRIAGL